MLDSERFETGVVDMQLIFMLCGAVGVEYELTLLRGFRVVYVLYDVYVPHVVCMLYHSLQVLSRS